MMHLMYENHAGGGDVLMEGESITKTFSAFYHSGQYIVCLSLSGRTLLLFRDFGYYQYFYFVI